MELLEMAKILRQRFRLIAAIVIIAVLATTGLTLWVLPPVYEAKAELIVNKPAEDDTSALNWDTVAVNLQLMSTYRQLAGSKSVMDEVLKLNPSLPYTSRELMDMVEVNVQDGTQLITLVAEDHSYERAAEIAGLAAKAFKTKVAEIMGADHVTIISDPMLIGPEEPVGPHLVLNVSATFVLSLIFGILAAFAVHHADDTIRSDEDLAGLDVPVLGVVPNIDKKISARRQTVKADRKAGENVYAAN